jgi:hypothetical protein
MFKKIAKALVIVAAGTGIILGSTQAAQAGTGEQFYGGTHFNAWSGGPDINAYGPSTANNDFTFALGSSQFESLIVSTGGGSHSGQCIADDGNQSGDARAALEPCTSSTPWGANFQVVTCSANSNQIALYNTHWQGYLAPVSTANGSAFYLNHQGQWCYTPQSAA